MRVNQRKQKKILLLASFVASFSPGSTSPLSLFLLSCYPSSPIALPSLSRSFCRVFRLWLLESYLGTHKISHTSRKLEKTEMIRRYHGIVFIVNYKRKRRKTQSWKWVKIKSRENPLAPLTRTIGFNDFNGHFFTWESSSVGKATSFRQRVSRILW